MSVAQVYDIEASVEGGIAVALTRAGLTCFTSQDVATQQRGRPRVEVSFALGAGNQRFVTIDRTTGTALASGEATWADRRESAWDCVITLCVITEASMSAHSSYRSTVRNVMASVWNVINGTAPMTRHCFYHVRDGGSTALMMDQDIGYYRTDFTYHGKISVQADAWSALGT